MTEQELVRRAKGGDQDAFAELVTAHQDRIYTLCLRMTGNREDAQDAAQEAFLNAWRGLASFQGGSSFSTWLYRLASNACIDLLRRRKRRQEGEAPHSLDDEEAGWPEPAAPGGGPEEELEQKERRQALERELRALPDHQREILVMREVSGLSYQEIGELLSLDLGTVKSRLARARLALKKRLLENGNFFTQSASKPSEETKRR